MLFLLAASLTFAFGLFRGSALGFSSRPEIEFVIRLSVAVSSAPFLRPSVVFQNFSPPHVRHVEVSQPKRTRELPQLVETKGLGEDVGVLPIRRNISMFNFTGEDKIVDKVVVHLNVLGPGMEDGVLR